MSSLEHFRLHFLFFRYVTVFESYKLIKRVCVVLSVPSISSMDKPTSLECKPEIKTMEDLLAKYDEMINENAIVSKSVLKTVKQNAEKLRKQIAEMKQKESEAEAENTWSTYVLVRL